MSLKRILAGLLIVGLSQIVLMGSAAADVEKGLYAAVNGGLAWTANLTYTTGNAGCSPFPPYLCTYPTFYNAVTYDLGYSAGAQIGYSFGGPRVEFEYNYRNNAASTIASQAGTQSASGDLTANSAMVNVLYDFDTGSKWIPYVGLGLGVADVKANNIHSNDSTKPGSFLDGGGSKFAAQFIFGVEYQMSDRMGLTIDWRGLWSSGQNFNYGLGCAAGGTGGGCIQTGVTSYDYWNGALNVGLRLKF